MENKEVEIKHLSQVEVDLLIAEFNYISNTAFQSNEDRARVSHIFFVTFASLIAALLSTQLNTMGLISQIYLAFAIILIVDAIWGGITIFQLARLRLTWHESLLAMNQIKLKVAEHSPYLNNYFRWNMDVVPRAFKANSFGFALAILVSTISGLATGFAVAFLALFQQPTSITVPWVTCIVSGISCALIYILLFYWIPLRKQDIELPSTDQNTRS